MTLYKQTLVTVQFRNLSYTKLVSGILRPDGSMSVPVSTLEGMAKELGWSPGQTYSRG